jgi:hypothetical protein
MGLHCVLLGSGDGVGLGAILSAVLFVARFFADAVPIVGIGANARICPQDGAISGAP